MHLIQEMHCRFLADAYLSARAATMDRKAYLQELGLDESAQRDDLILAYRRLLIEWHPERTGLSENSKAELRASAVTSAFLFLEKIYPQKSTLSRHGKSFQTADFVAMYGPPRFQTTLFEPTSLIFSPARSVTELGFVSAFKSPEVSPGSPSKEVKSPVQSTALIGSLVVVLVLIAFSLVLDEREKNSSPIDSPVPQMMSAETNETHQVESTLPIPAPKDRGRILARTNRTNAKMELRQQDGSGAISAARTGNDFEFQSIPSGEYRLIAHLEGWPDVVRTITLSENQSAEVSLEFLGGSLRIESDPSNASVKIGGKLIGSTPLTVKDLPPGSQSITLQYKSWPELTTALAVEANREGNETIRIPHGQLDIETNPSGAMVSIDGAEVGRTPLVIDQVSAGKRQLRLTAENYEPYETLLSIADRGMLKIQPTLSSNIVQLDPNNLLNLVWTNGQQAGRKYEIAPDFESTSTFRPKNGVIKNLDRQKLYAKWAGRLFRYEGTVKEFDPKTGMLEFSDESGEKSKYKVVAQLSSRAKANKVFLTKLLKGAHVEVFGRFTAAEEPRWPSKTILFELGEAEPVN